MISSLACVSWSFHPSRILLPHVPSDGCSSEDKLLEFEGEAGRSDRMEGWIGIICISFQKSVK